MFGFDDLMMGGIGIAGGLMNNLFAGKRQDDVNQFNAQQAQMNRDFQERMSNTVYQRSAADMKAAGLNPMAMYGTGLSASGAPAGSTATGVMAPVHDVLGNAVSTAMQSKRVNAEVDNMVQTNSNLKKEVEKKDAEIGAIQVQNAIGHQQVENMKELWEQLKAEANKSKTLQEFWNSPAGKLAATVGAAGPAVSTATDLVGGVVGKSIGNAAGTFADRWKARIGR